jgi:hypothetical protein
MIDANTIKPGAKFLMNGAVIKVESLSKTEVNGTLKEDAVYYTYIGQRIDPIKAMFGGGGVMGRRLFTEMAEDLIDNGTGFSSLANFLFHLRKVDHAIGLELGAEGRCVGCAKAARIFLADGPFSDPLTEGLLRQAVALDEDGYQDVPTAIARLEAIAQRARDTMIDGVAN